MIEIPSAEQGEPPGESSAEQDDPEEWQLYVDGSACNKGSGIGIVLFAPEGGALELSVRLGFSATNNVAEYEALLAGLRAARTLKVQKLRVHCDSQLVVNQLSGVYAVKSEKLGAYVDKAKEGIKEFERVRVKQITSGQNAHADSLACLASALPTEYRRHVTVEYLEGPSIGRAVEVVMETEHGPSWMDPIVNYLRHETLPDDSKEAHRVKAKSARFWFSPEGKLYKKSFSGPYLLCVHPSLVQQFLYEIHEGVCGSHAGARSIAHRAISQGYWWPYMQEDAKAYTKKCEKCQKFKPMIRAPAEDLLPLTSPWPFAQWGLDIVGPLPQAAGKVKFLLMATDYFTKWIEAEALADITEPMMEKFVWQKIITRFGVPYSLISDNGPQFQKKFEAFCGQWKIRNYYSSPAYPPSNGQAEASNKTILAGIKKRLESKKGRWPEELPLVLWAYRTTPRSSTGETPYSLTYGTEAIIPLEIGLPTNRTALMESGGNDQALLLNLDLAEEKREKALVRLASYQQHLRKSYNKKVNPREFNIGDQVLRKVLGNTKVKEEGKLGANWEGPYTVVGIAGKGSYRLIAEDGEPVPRPWNAQNLKKFWP